MITRRVHTPTEWDLVHGGFALVRRYRTAGAFFPYDLDTYPWLLRPLVAVWKGIPGVVLFLIRTFILWGPFLVFSSLGRHDIGYWWATLPVDAMRGAGRVVRFPAQTLLFVLYIFSAGSMIIPAGIAALWVLSTFARFYNRIVPTLLAPVYVLWEHWADAWGASVDEQGLQTLGAGRHRDDLQESLATRAWVLRQMQREARQLGTPPPQRIS